MDRFAVDLGEWFEQNEPQVREDLSDYFNDDASPEDSYTGRWFDRYAEKGDPNRFEGTDLIAIESLSVRVPPEAAAAILLTEQADELNQRLAGIPIELEPGSERALEAVGPDSDASKLYAALVKFKDVKRVKASKLIAAKRPHLIPVIDQTIDELLKPPRGLFWETMHRELADPVRRRAIEKVCNNAPGHVSLLRRIDVAVWMAGGGRHSRGRGRRG